MVGCNITLQKFDPHLEMPKVEVEHRQKQKAIVVILFFFGNHTLGGVTQRCSTVVCALLFVVYIKKSYSLFASPSFSPS